MQYLVKKIPLNLIVYMQGEMLETTIEVKLDKVPKGFDLGERVLGDSVSLSALTQDV